MGDVCYRSVHAGQHELSHDIKGNTRPGVRGIVDGMKLLFGGPDQQEELRTHKDEIKELRAQLSDLATEISSLREQVSRSSVTPLKRHPAFARSLSRQSRVKELAAVIGASLAIQDLERSC